MNDDDLRRRLAATNLSTPGVSLDEVLQRAAASAPSRTPSWAFRLALAAAIVWLMVLVAQTSVERNVAALTRSPGPAAQVGGIAAGPAGSTATSLALRHRLLRELLADGTWPDVMEPEPPRDQGRARPARSAREGHRDRVVRRYCYV